jgi:hypothetical protein
VVSIAISSSTEKVVDTSGVTFLAETYASIKTVLATRATTTTMTALGLSKATRIDHNALILDTNSNNVQNSTTQVSVTFASKKRPLHGIPEKLHFSTHTFSPLQDSDFMRDFREESTASLGLLMV